MQRLAILTLLGILLYFSNVSAVFAEYEERTAGRSSLGWDIDEGGINKSLKHYEFLGMRSNWRVQVDQPAALQGQAWDTAQWNSKWIPHGVIAELFNKGVFYIFYIKAEQVPILELGPVFYTLSDLDRRRTLKLFIDQSDILQKGNKILTLIDWKTKKIVGSYTAEGMFLN